MLLSSGEEKEKVTSSVPLLRVRKLPAPPRLNLSRLGLLTPESIINQQEARGLNWDPRGHWARSGDTLEYHSSGAVSGISWVEVRDAVKYSKCSGQLFPPSHTTGVDLFHNASGTEVRKPCLRLIRPSPRLSVIAGGQ